MKKSLFILAVALSGLLSFSVKGQQPIQWSSSVKALGEGQYEIELKARISSGYHLYSIYTPEGGPKAATLSIEKAGEGIELIGEPREGQPMKEYDEIFKVDVLFFEKDYKVVQKFKITDASIKSVNANMDYQLCREGECMNLEQDFSLEISGTEKLAAGNAEKDNIAEKDKIKRTKTGPYGQEDDSLWTFFWLAFIGGLAAVVMPCVFPMIPMTVSFFMHGDTNKAKARSKALFFAFSIVAIYTLLGLFISVVLGPDFINWLSTNWIPNILFFIIFMLFAASFFGAFEIVLPSWLVAKSDKQADRGGYIGAFFMAFTLVLVSFSCTAPIVGTVLVEAARGSILRPIIGMLGFSVAVALPFGFFAFFPSKLSNLPKSGGWLNAVKVVLGFIEVALGFKFLMVIDQTYHWGLLDREIYIAIWIAVFGLQALYLMGKLRFKHDSELTHIGIPRLIFLIITLTFVIYLIPGMFGAPLKALAGYLPPQESIDFDINRIVRDNAKEIMRSGVSTQVKKLPDEKIKYADFLHMPHGLDGYFDYEQGLAAAQKLDRPLFIDFTGKGCVNCREMEQSVWIDPRVMEILKNEYVIVALTVDDKTKLPEEEWYVSEYDGKKKKTLGKKNADFQISKFDSNSQPNYILLDSRGGNDKDLRPHILAPARGHNLDIDAFVEFLKAGVKEYKARKR